MSTALYHSLQGANVGFKPLSMEDYEIIHTYASDEEVSQYIGWPLMHTLEETKDFVAELMNKEASGTHFYASIIEKASGDLVGTATLFNFDKEANNAEIGYVFHPKAWGRGYCTEVIGMISDFGMKVLGLHKIHARVVEPNVASSKALLRNGFVLEGQLRDYYYIDEQYYDCLMYGKL